MNIAQRIWKIYLWIFSWNLQLYVICNPTPQVSLYMWNSRKDGREKAPATSKFPLPVEKLLVGHLTKKFLTFYGNHYRGHNLFPVS